MNKIIYTLGYGGRTIEEFLSIIHSFFITTVIDVRRFPRSKIPYFSKVYLEKILMHNGIQYYWLGDFLGGYRGSYRNYMTSKEYELGIAILEKILQYTLYSSGNAVIMCLEKNPKGCHRKFIAETLENKGYSVIYIIEKDKVMKHRELIESAGGGI
ncbi:MAG: DUF488 domain-containing protein [Thermoprotei archaeon]|nr:MAG: DUF488 domain-containing protein [Thermoprotei archaeon]